MTSEDIHIRFCGAARTVTGSCYLVTHPGGCFLVDCGMFQGSKTVKELNYGAFPFDPASVDFVLLTHAHMDHAGLIPKLVKLGFEGPIYGTEGSRDLLTYMLPDSGYIQEREVERLNRRNRQRGRDAVEPIYTREDGERALETFRAVDYAQWCDVADNVRVRYWNAGHILGSASIEVEFVGAKTDGTAIRVLFSGDIGPDFKMFHPDPEAPDGWDYVVCEGTYGDRVRGETPPAERRRRLAEEVNETLSRNGVLLIPAFAVERTQELLADLSRLMTDGVVPKVPLFLDSPLAIRATRIFAEHAGDIVDADGLLALQHNPNIHFTETVDQSKAIHTYSGGVIIVAASGMCDAGRIRHHLKRYLPSEKTKVLLVGYQATATLGQLLASGAKAVRIMGEDVKVKAVVKQFDVYSGHADADGLVAWLTARLPIRRKAFLTHGEERALEAFAERLRDAGLPLDAIHVPELDEEFDLTEGLIAHAGQAPKRRIEPEAVGRPDWHNELAQFSLDLRETLEQAADTKSRAVILRRLRRALTGETDK